ncbi:MAG TPA: hypothetical protein PLW35_01765 [Verrucomicrobiota bacterium]|nr:hypothetical protein [Verrucomicrobiota bacterium]
MRQEQPDLQTLALMAASSGRRNAKDAVRFAQAVWNEARRALGLIEPALPMPGRWPATGKDFMRLVVRGRTEADSVGRLRQFFFEQKSKTLLFHGKLAAEDRKECEQYAAGMVGRIRKSDYVLDERGWRRLAGEYLTWWRAHLSEQRKLAAGKRKGG